MFKRFAVSLCFVIPVTVVAQEKILSNTEVFDQIHKNETIALTMERGFFEFRLYRDPKDPTSILLEYLSETGKVVIFKCDSGVSKVKTVKGVHSLKNNLEKKCLNRLYRYSASYSAYYHEG